MWIYKSGSQPPYIHAYGPYKIWIWKKPLCLKYSVLRRCWHLGLLFVAMMSFWLHTLHVETREVYRNHSNDSVLCWCVQQWHTGCIKMIGAVLKLIIFTSMVNRIINTSRNERVTQVYDIPTNVRCMHPSSHGTHRGNSPIPAILHSASQVWWSPQPR